MNNLPLIEKYRVKSFDAIIGQDKAISEIKTFFKLFPMKRAIIINGPAGTGKTSLAISLAKEYNLELFEMNSSDLRNRLSLEEVLRPAALQSSLFKKSKIILMDEADGITGTDRGGIPELIALIEKTSFPIVITANDIWHKKFNLLRRKCSIINLKELKAHEIKYRLNEILKKENKKVSENTIEVIAEKSRGDMRAALNDLQSVIENKDYIIKQEISEREKEESIFNALKKLFQSKTDEKTVNIYDNVNKEMDEIMLWVEENIPEVYNDSKSLEKAYDSLSNADKFKGRIYRQQYWRFLVYQNFFLSFGVSSAKRVSSDKFIKYKPPSRILKIWLANQRNMKKKSILAKYGRVCHMSIKKAAKDYHLIPFILDNINKKTKDQLDLDEKEIDYLKEKKGAIIVATNLNRFRI